MLTHYKKKSNNHFIKYEETWLCGDAGGNILERMCNNTPSNAIVNAVSNISYRLLLETIIQSTYTGRCYRPRFLQYFFINKFKNLTNVVIENIGKLSQTKLFLRLFLILEIIILLLHKLDILLLKQKKLPVLDITDFFFRIQLIAVIFILYSSKSNENSKWTNFIPGNMV